MIPFRPYNIKYLIPHKHYTFYLAYYQYFQYLCRTVVYLFQSLRLNKNKPDYTIRLAIRLTYCNLPTATGDRILFLLVFFYKGTEMLGYKKVEENQSKLL